MSTIAFRPLTPFEVGRKEFRIKCPHCKRLLGAGSHLIRVVVAGISPHYVYVHRVRHHCNDNTILMPYVFPSEDAAEEVAACMTKCATEPGFKALLVHFRDYFGLPVNN